MLWDNLEGWDGGSKREETCVYLWLIHGDVRQKPYNALQHCKAIILELKIQIKKKKRACSSGLALFTLLYW